MGRAARTGGPVPYQTGAPPPPPAYPADAGWRGRRVLSLAATAVLALGAGGAAVVVAQDLREDATPTAQQSTAPGPHGAAGPQGGTISEAPGASGSGAVTVLMLLGQVTAVGRDSVTLGGPGGTISAAVTSVTQFTGRVRSLRGVRAGDQVAMQVRVTNGVARLVTIQDPAS
jgi:hypothetical protein